MSKNMVSHEKAPRWLRVVSLLMIGVVKVRCSYSNGEKLPLNAKENFVQQMPNQADHLRESTGSI